MMDEPQQKKPYQVLGLDIGMGSLGWCLLDIANEQVTDMGVHLWETPQEPKTKVSTATTRRIARSSRRSTKRHANRMAECLKLLKANGLLPENAAAASLQTVKGDIQPLESRVKALDEKLTDRELAQALYNLCNRRGYIPHGDGDASDPDGKRVLTAISHNTKLMAERGYRTVGEMMLEEGRAQGKQYGASRNKSGNYDRCLTMEQLLSEADAIFEAQRALENPNATEQFQADFKACMSWQKPTYDRDGQVYKTVGTCEYFPNEKRAARACLSFERCAAHERLCNVRIVMPDNSERSLPADLRARAMSILFSPVPVKGNKTCKFRYTDIRKELDVPAYAYFKGVGADEEKLDVYEPMAWRKLRSNLSAAFMDKLWLDPRTADILCSALTFASTEQSLRERIACLSDEQLGKQAFSDHEIDEFCKLPYSSDLFKGYGNRSLKALRLLNDAFKSYDEVASLYEAEQACGLGGLKEHSKEAGKRLIGKLPAYTEFDPTCNNPVVLRVMGRVRKLVNAVIAKYGIPDEIHIELARDLKRSAREKKLIEKSQAKHKASNEASRNRIAESLGCDPSEVRGKLIRKVNLLNEQDERDVYTGEHISYERLIAEGDAYCQIDHILPYSRTCDDSQSNKVLVLVKSNQDKRERSPYEWLGDTPQWADFKNRVVDLRLHGYPKKKADKLLEEHLNEKQDGFIERNLNDTRYASRAAKEYLEHYLQFPESEAPNGIVRKKRVCAVAGGSTTTMRHIWGFDGKDRDKDDLHHAVDAAIIAACREETVKAVARYSEKRRYKPEEERRKLLIGSEPWVNFAKQIQACNAKVIPTRKVEYGVTGRLFEDTVYRFDGYDEDENKGILTAKGKSKPSGNFVLDKESNSAVKPDGMAYLRLWWNPEARKGKGEYLREPVYYSDIAFIKNGSYTPRYCVTDKARCNWPLVPLDIVENQEPIILRRGQLLTIGGEMMRFIQFNTSDNALWLSQLKKFPKRTAPKESIGKATSPNFIEVIHEDILGDCFKSEE